MRWQILAVAVLLVLGGLHPVSASDHPLLGCLHCRVGKVSHLLSYFDLHPAHRQPEPVMTGNCAFGPCGGGVVPGPWYTYWPCAGQPNLTSAYESPTWTYLSHFQTPAPLLRPAWQTPEAHGPSFSGVPYYWSGR